MTRQLTQAQKMASISRVTGGIAHNFNNLLTGIMGFCNLLADGACDRETDRSSLDKIMGAAAHGGELVQQLLAFSQQQILEPEVFDLNGTVVECESLLRQIAGEHVDVTLDLGPTPGPVRADPKQIVQVISNLVTNAVEAMPAGGRLTLVTRHLELDGFSIRDFGIPQGRYVLLEVVDSGTGIDERVYDRIFEPFFSTKDDLNGTGLGLSVVYGAVKQSGGQIRVESSPGAGTRFRIYLPRTDQRLEAASASTPAPDPNALGQPTDRRQTILLAEDEPTVRQALQKFLAGQGYRVLTASDGMEGVERSSRFHGEIDLLLTDIVMPQMDGLELAQAVFAQRTGTKVLFISGYTQEREVLSELVEGAEVDFLQKPFENEDLEIKLRTLCNPSSPQCAPRAAA